MMYQNNYPSTPNWNGPINPSVTSSPQIPVNYQNGNMSFPQQMAQYGPTNMSYPQANQQMNLPQTSIRGRVVADISQVVPNEVPMDGSVSLFPSQDYSCIYAKQWAADGTIKTMKFIPAVETQVVEAERVNPVDILRADVMSRLDNIQEMISGLTTIGTKKTTTTRKEAE